MPYQYHYYYRNTLAFAIYNTIYHIQFTTDQTMIIAIAMALPLPSIIITFTMTLTCAITTPINCNNYYNGCQYCHCHYPYHYY